MHASMLRCLIWLGLSKAQHLLVLQICPYSSTCLQLRLLVHAGHLTASSCSGRPSLLI
jgi:hypothetical protein